MTPEHYSTLTFQELREQLAGVIKRIRDVDACGLPADTLVAEAGSIMATLHQFMERHKDTPLYDTY